MVEWNPVEGLKELTWEDLRVGDDVVQKSEFNPGTYTRIQNIQPFTMSRETKYYLLDRRVIEPENRGDVVELYRKNNDSNLTDTVEIYIRTRPKTDDGFEGEEPWTDSANQVTRSWAGIVGRAESSGYSLKVSKARYVQEL